MISSPGFTGAPSCIAEEGRKLGLIGRYKEKSNQILFSYSDNEYAFSTYLNDHDRIKIYYATMHLKPECSAINVRLPQMQELLNIIESACGYSPVEVNHSSTCRID